MVQERNAALNARHDTNDTDPRQDPACRRTDPAVFDTLDPGDIDDGTHRGDIAAAKRICAGCPVRTACLQHAVDAAEPTGVWGGATPAERRAIAGGRARTGRGKVAAADSARMRAEAVRMRDQGLTATAIAARLGVTERSVRRWVALRAVGS
jgi:WhiB family redox-sensing transcriptional regulator